MNRNHLLSTVAAIAMPLLNAQAPVAYPGYGYAQPQMPPQYNGQPAMPPQGYAQPMAQPAGYGQPMQPGFGQPMYYAQPVIAPQYQQYPQGPGVQPSGYPGAPTYVGQGAGVYGQPRRVMLPAGTTLFVTTGQALRSNVLQPGQAFEAFLDAPLFQGDVMIADRGARVEGRVVDANVAGKISGQSGLALQLVRMQTADGKTLDLHTTTVAMSGGTGYGKDVARVASMSAIGAVIGGIAGGGRGAAIGAGAGAGAGGAWALKTRGPQTVVGAEARLQFQLLTPIMFTTW